MIINRINGFKLTKSSRADFYQVVLPNGETIANASGTREDVINELERWKNEIDFNNEFMLKVENGFIDALRSI
jgi:hypothetical protein